MGKYAILGAILGSCIRHCYAPAVKSLSAFAAELMDMRTQRAVAVEKKPEMDFDVYPAIPIPAVRQGMPAKNSRFVQSHRTHAALAN